MSTTHKYYLLISWVLRLVREPEKKLQLSILQPTLNASKRTIILPLTDPLVLLRCSAGCEGSVATSTSCGDLGVVGVSGAAAIS